MRHHEILSRGFRVAHLQRSRAVSDQSVYAQVSQHLRRVVAIGRCLRNSIEQLRRALKHTLGIAAREIDLHLHQFAGQIVRIVAFQVAGKNARLIDRAGAEIRFRHKEQSRA